MIAVVFCAAAFYAAAFWRYATMRRRADELRQCLSLVNALAVAVRDRCLPFAFALRQAAGHEGLRDFLAGATTPSALAARMETVPMSAACLAATRDFFKTAETGSRESVALGAERLAAALETELAPLAARLPSEWKLTLLLPLFLSAMLFLFLL